MAYTYKPYEESDEVKRYRQQLEQQQAARPGEYQSQWADQLKQTVEQINGRPKFQYNLNSDPLYDQYRQQAMRNGKLAMQDTMGAAATMNGGYGSSYAQMAGQQAYNGEIQKLNDRIPELYGMALERYQAEGNDLLNRFGVLGQMESTDYGRHQDSMAQWQADRNFAANQYDTERGWDYGKFGDDFSRDFQMTQYNAELARQQVDQMLAMGAEIPDELLAASGYSKEYIDAMRAAQAAGGGSGGGGNSADFTKAEYMLANGGYNSAEMLQLIRTSPLTESEQAALIEKYQQPLQKQEVNVRDPKRDNSAYWSMR